MDSTSPASPVISPMRAAFMPPRRKRTILVLALCAVLLLAAWAGAWFLQRPTGMRHYLLLGRDQWGEHNDRGRTDVMLMVTLDFDGSRVLTTSFLRDTQITLPKGGQGKLNTLAQAYGDAAVADYVSETYGVAIDGVFSVNFTSMMRILDAVGGVTVTLSPAEVRYLRVNAGDYPPDFNLHEGDCLLNGAQAVAYMRCRKLDSDMGRVNRQANVLAALMQQVRHMGASKALGLVPTFAGTYTTDLPLADQLSLARDAFRLRYAPLSRHQIPSEGTFRYGSLEGSSVLVINQEKNAALFSQFLQGK